jgi:hypothetical protein
VSDLIALQVALDQMAFVRRADPDDVAVLVEARRAVYELSVLKSRIRTVMEGI